MSKKISNIKRKIEYEKGKVEQLDKKIRKKGGKFNGQLVRLDVHLQVIKEILFREKIITKEEFELEYLKKIQIVLNNILEEIERIKKEGTTIIIPKAKIPKDLKGFKA